MQAIRSFVFSYTLLLKIALGVVAIFAGAQITINIQPVPITLQTLVVLMIGLSYTPKESVLTVLSYIGCGAVGIPVFYSYGFGIAALTGPTAGYLLGMVIAVYLMGSLREKYHIKSYMSILGVCILGQASIFTVGVSWLSYMIGFEQACIHGCLVFIPSGLVKTLLLTLVIRYIKSNN